MSIEGRFWLGTAGSETLFETGWTAFSETEIPFTREGRTANGSLVIDILAIKKLFTLTYAVMTQDTLDDLMTEYDKGEMLSLIVEREGGGTDTYTVRFRPIARTRLDARGDWLWQGATFQLEEA